MATKSLPLTKIITKIVEDRFPELKLGKGKNSKTVEGRTISLVIENGTLTEKEQKALFTLLRVNPILEDAQWTCNELEVKTIKDIDKLLVRLRRTQNFVEEAPKSKTETKETPKRKENALVMEDLFKLISQNIPEYFNVADRTKQVVVDMLIKEGGIIEVTITNITKKTVRIGFFDKIKAFIKNSLFSVNSVLWIKNETGEKDYFRLTLKTKQEKTK